MRADKGDVSGGDGKRCHERGFVSAALGGNNDVALDRCKRQKTKVGYDAINLTERDVVLCRCHDGNGEAQPLSEVGQCDGYRATATYQQLRPRQHWLNEDVQGPLTGTHVAYELHAFLRLPGLHAKLPQCVTRLH